MKTLRNMIPFNILNCTVLLCMLNLVCSFAPSVRVPFSSKSESKSAVFGVRSEIRRRFSPHLLAKRFFPEKAPAVVINETLDTELHSIKVVENFATEQSMYRSYGVAVSDNLNGGQVGTMVDDAYPRATTQLFRTIESGGSRKHLDELSLLNSATLVRAKSAASTSHVSLYSLPETKRALSRLEKEFREMLEFFANYSEADLLSIADPRKRALFEGIAASSHSQPVYRAFEVLFEDLLPLRLAGRVIFSRLKEFMAASVEQRQTEIDTVVALTGLSNDVRQLEEIRLMFVSTASQLNGDSFLTLAQLSETGIISATATEVLGFDSSKELLERLDTANSGRLTFVDLMNGLWRCANEYCGLESCNPRTVLHNLLVELNEHPPPSTDFNARLDANRRRFSARYNEMVSSFIQWKHLLPPPPADGSSEGRRMDVVRGCFAGAELPKVVDALRVVYVDYAGLRVAGDIIFKLASTLLNRR